MTQTPNRSDALVLVDVLATFDHTGGDALYDAFRSARDALVRVIEAARAEDVPVVYANDDFGTWSGDRTTVVEQALAAAPDPDVLRGITPVDGDAFLAKPRYSAFDHTALELFLAGRDIRRVLVAGTATEMCVAQTAIAAREHGFQVTVLVDACSSVRDEDAALALRYLERVAGARLHSGATLPAPDDPE